MARILIQVVVQADPTLLYSSMNLCATAALILLSIVLPLPFIGLTLQWKLYWNYISNLYDSNILKEIVLEIENIWQMLCSYHDKGSIQLHEEIKKTKHTRIFSL